MGPDDTTTGAELRCVRDALGLSLDWLANHLGVTPAALRQWESERHGKRPPANVTHRVWELLAQQETHITNVVEQTLATTPARVTLLRFRSDADLAGHNVNLPAPTHGVAQLHIARELQDAGRDVRIIWFNPVQYQHWLDTQPGDLKDTPHNRQVWADQLA